MDDKKKKKADSGDLGDSPALSKRSVLVDKQQDTAETPTIMSEKQMRVQTPSLKTQLVLKTGTTRTVNTHTSTIGCCQGSSAQPDRRRSVRKRSAALITLQTQHPLSWGSGEKAGVAARKQENQNLTRTKPECLNLKH